MVREDLEAVLENETRAYVYPWTYGIFKDCLSAGYDCRVATYRNTIVGHSIMTFGAGEAHLLNVCVRRDQQGKGFGRLMVSHVLDRARVLGGDVLFLEVRPTNAIALKLYDSLGFREIGTRKDYYPSAVGREDAQVLALQLGTD
jgi:ribosomal-protein-alanine N-acetyltransferase